MLELKVETEVWAFKAPFRISGYVFTEAETVLVSLGRKGRVGYGEAAGVYYHEETPASLRRQLLAARAEIEACASRDALLEILPPGGARNAVDCALWDLEAKEQGLPAWHNARLAPPKPLATTITIGADTPDAMAARARALFDAPQLKIKLTGEDDAPGLIAVRKARPDAWIGVDANQGYDRAGLEKLYPTLLDCGVQLIEQPFAIGREAELDGFRHDIPIAADESVQCAADMARLKGRFDMINIKLDKSGGLTEALRMVAEARRLGLKVMVGCMGGTSLSVAPALLAGQQSDVVDLDAPLFLARDRWPNAIYKNGMVSYGDAGWGNPYSAAQAKAS